jgi:hypothetical protein
MSCGASLVASDARRGMQAEQLESRAEGTQWLQVTYLVDHEIELVELSQAVFTCLDT